MNPILMWIKHDSFHHGPMVSSSLKNNDGQSMIEFLLTLAFAMALIFLFIQLALNSGAAYMAHYATFMSARTFLTWDNNSNEEESAENDAKAEAIRVFDSFNMRKYYLDYVEFGINKLSDLSSRGDKLYAGAYFAFKQKLSTFAWIARNKESFMVTEAYLGKEPTRRICLLRTCYSIKYHTDYSGISCDNPTGNDLHLTVFDNGC
jgi:hypothetical protein